MKLYTQRGSVTKELVASALLYHVGNKLRSAAWWHPVDELKLYVEAYIQRKLQLKALV